MSTQGSNPLSRIPEATRAWAYRLIAAAIPLIYVVGAVVSGDAVSQAEVATVVLGFVSALLATANTSRHPDDVG